MKSLYKSIYIVLLSLYIVYVVALSVFAGSYEYTAIWDYLWFVPMGILIPLLSKAAKYCLYTVAYGLGVSVALLAMKMAYEVFPSAANALGDVVFQTLGTFSGFCLCSILIIKEPRMKKICKIYSFTKKIWITLIATTIAIAAGILVITLFINDVGGKGNGIVVSELDNESETNNSQNISKPSETDTEKPTETIIQQTTQAPTQAPTEAPTQPVVASPLQKAFESTVFTSKSFCIMKLSNASVIYGYDMNSKVPPASTTKMITAIVANEHCTLDEQVTVGKEIEYVTEDASLADLIEGEILTIEQLYYCLMLPSGNDAAYTLAVYTGAKLAKQAGVKAPGIDVSLAYFMKEVNNRAKQLGAYNSNFVRPDGDDADNQYSTAYDLARILKGLIESEYNAGVLKKVIGTYEYTVIPVSGKRKDYFNSNQLINIKNDYGYYNTKVLGGKTGTTDLAGTCVVFYANINACDYIVSIMKDQGGYRYVDANKIIEIVGQY